MKNNRMKLVAAVLALMLLCMPFAQGLSENTGSVQIFMLPDGSVIEIDAGLTDEELTEFLARYGVASPDELIPVTEGFGYKPKEKPEAKKTVVTQTGSEIPETGEQSDLTLPEQTEVTENDAEILNETVTETEPAPIEETPAETAADEILPENTEEQTEVPEIAEIEEEQTEVVEEAKEAEPEEPAAEEELTEEEEPVEEEPIEEEELAEEEEAAEETEAEEVEEEIAEEPEAALSYTVDVVIANPQSVYHIGDTIRLESVINGECPNPVFRWQVSRDGGDWQDIEGANESFYEYSVSMDVIANVYRVIVTAAPETEPAAVETETDAE